MLWAYFVWDSLRCFTRAPLRAWRILAWRIFLCIEDSRRFCRILGTIFCEDRFFLPPLISLGFFFRGRGILHVVFQVLLTVMKDPCRKDLVLVFPCDSTGSFRAICSITTGCWIKLGGFDPEISPLCRGPSQDPFRIVA